MPDESDPPRKFYQLKPKEFERVNAPRPGAEAAPPTGADPGPGAVPSGPAQRIDVRDLARQAAGSAPLLGGVNAPSNRANDVHQMLRDNLQQANTAGLNDVGPPKKRRSRRKRDFWLLLFVGNAPFVYFVVKGGNVITLVYSGAAIILFTLGLVWIMWVVMDDY